DNQARCASAGCHGVVRRDRRCRACGGLAWSHEPVFWMWEREDRAPQEARRCMACACLFFQHQGACPAPNCGARNWSMRTTTVWRPVGQRTGRPEILAGLPDGGCPPDEGAALDLDVDAGEVLRRLAAWPPDDPLRPIAQAIWAEDREDYD